MIDSISAMVVSNSSYVSLAYPMTFLKHLLVERINLSKIPPHHGDLARLNVDM